MKHLLNPKLILFGSLFFIIWPLFIQGYFSHHDDLQVMRIFEMRKCFSDFQIPCRWVPDMGYGNGFPLFNYYGPFPYYIGAIVSFFVGFVIAAKFLFFVSLVLGVFAMYLLAKEVFGEIGGLTGAFLYMFAPYRALDIYVRGAIAESFALALIPLVFFLTLKLIKDKKIIYLVLNSLTLAFFLTSHTIMTMYFIPLLIFWAMFWIISQKDFKVLKGVIVSFLLGFALASFYIVPAYAEKSLVQTDNLIRGDLNFRAHFVTLRQLFLSRNWGYGASVLGDSDNISFQIGWPHWWVVVASFLAASFVLIKQKNKEALLVLAFVAVFIGSIFMTHNQSAFIWERIEILKYSQFPWRFLSVTIFCSALIGAGFVNLVGNKVRYVLATIIMLVTVLFNVSFFSPEVFLPNVDDKLKLSGKEWDQQSKAAIMDYLPKTATQPREPSAKKPFAISGNTEVGDYYNGSNNWYFTAQVKEQSQLVVPIFDFPNWEVQVNGRIYSHSADKILGRISLDLKPGEYQVKGRLQDTMIRQVTNWLSVVSLALLIIIAKYGKIKNYLF